MAGKLKLYVSEKCDPLASFWIHKHFCAISGGRDIDLQSLIIKIDNITFVFLKIETEYTFYTYYIANLILHI